MLIICGEGFLMNNLSRYSQRDLSGRGVSETFYSSTSTFDKISAKILPPGHEHVKAALNYLSGLNDDWDGEDAIAPTEQAIEAAHAINNNFMLDRKYPDKVSPDGDGAILFIWNTEKRVTFTIEAALIHVSVEYSDGHTDLPDSVPYDLTAIPKEILQYIPKVKYSND